jgi:hypothetical protein
MPRNGNNCDTIARFLPVRRTLPLDGLSVSLRTADDLAVALPPSGLDLSDCGKIAPPVPRRHPRTTKSTEESLDVPT